MLKIKNKIINAKLVLYIEKSYHGNLENSYCIDVYFTNGALLTIEFDSEEERNRLFNNIIKIEE